jgi:hypothetical protein
MGMVTEWSGVPFYDESRGNRLVSLSDRTLCYLASGRPAVVEHTGPSAFLSDDAGLFRFRDLTEAVVFSSAWRRITSISQRSHDRWRRRTSTRAR